MNTTITLDLEEAEKIIEKFWGHLCIFSGQFQFSIKMHNMLIPEKVKQELSHDLIEEVIISIAKEELEAFMESLKEEFPWIMHWYTAGRSGGWLILEHEEDIGNRINYCNNYEDNLKWAKSELNQLIINNIISPPNLEREIKINIARRRILRLKQEYNESKKIIIYTANDLLKIEKLVREGVRRAEKLLSTEEAYLSSTMT